MKYFQSFIALCMSMIILGASTGFTMHMHICSGNLHDIGFFSTAEACDMDDVSMSAMSCEKNKMHKEEVKQPSCCNDQTFLNDKHDLINKTDASDFLTLIPVFRVVLNYLFAPLSSLITFRQANFQFYIPPLIGQNIPVFVQSFLL